MIAGHPFRWFGAEMSSFLKYEYPILNLMKNNIVRIRRKCSRRTTKTYFTGILRIISSCIQTANVKCGTSPWIRLPYVGQSNQPFRIISRVTLILSYFCVQIGVTKPSFGSWGDTKILLCKHSSVSWVHKSHILISISTTIHIFHNSYLRHEHTPKYNNLMSIFTFTKKNNYICVITLDNVLFAQKCLPK